MTKWTLDRLVTGWPTAVDRLSKRHEEHGARLARLADSYGAEYANRRGSMVVDVVASRQRRYRSAVAGRIVPLYEETMGDPSLAALAESEPSFLRLRRDEATTMQRVAQELLRFGDGDDEESTVRQWAEAVEPVRFAHRLDPFVGQLSGIGPALFAYLRMRCGADAIKPDLRVRAALSEVGLLVGSSPAALLTVAEALASELDVRRLVLDQMLWTSKEPPPEDERN